MHHVLAYEAELVFGERHVAHVAVVGPLLGGRLGHGWPSYPRWRGRGVRRQGARNTSIVALSAGAAYAYALTLVNASCVTK